jgi:hypothetical protein
MIHYQYYPQSARMPAHLENLVDQFRAIESSINSETHDLNSNEVLALLSPGLGNAGYRVELSKAAADKISVPVLFGRDGKLEKSFDADAYHELLRTVVEVEAGRAYTNNQFLKDLFEACVMVNVDYIAIAVRNLYRKGRDFDRVARFIDSLYAGELKWLPLEGVLIIGY